MPARPDAEPPPPGICVPKRTGIRKSPFILICAGSMIPSVRASTPAAPPRNASEPVEYGALKLPRPGVGSNGSQP